MWPDNAAKILLKMDFKNPDSIVAINVSAENDVGFFQKGKNIASGVRKAINAIHTSGKRQNIISNTVTLLRNIELFLLLAVIVSRTFFMPPLNLFLNRS